MLCNYAECYAERGVLFMLSVVMLNVIMPSVGAPISLFLNMRHLRAESKFEKKMEKYFQDYQRKF